MHHDGLIVESRERSARGSPAGVGYGSEPPAVRVSAAGWPLFWGVEIERVLDAVRVAADHLEEHWKKFMRSWMRHTKTNCRLLRILIDRKRSGGD